MPIAIYLTLAHNQGVNNQTRMDIMIQGLNPRYRKYIQIKQPRTYHDATKALLLKDSVALPSTKTDKKLLEVLKKTTELMMNKGRQEHPRQGG